MADEFVIAVPPALEGVAPVDVALILGSGLSMLAEAVENPLALEFDAIEGFPVPSRHVAGHAGRLVVGMLGGRRAAVFQGRIHCYQGFSAVEAAYPVRLAAALGARTLLVTNAAGALDPDLNAGDIVLVSDHINLTGTNPLVGWEGPVGGTPFVAMTDAYDPRLRTLAVEASVECGVDVVPGGVYAWLQGPTYETPAEAAMVRAAGADIVGMSTVPEVIAARALGLRVLALSLVTNNSAAHDIDHSDVLTAARIAADDVGALVLAILQRLS